MFYKPEFRKYIRARRKKLNPIAIQQSSLQIAARLIHLPNLIDSKYIGYYLPQEGEVDPNPIINCEIFLHKLFYLPVIKPEEQKLMAYYSYTAKEPLKANRYGILEPHIEEKKPIDITQLDVVFVPLVGFDHHCNRLGRGAGYYDHTFAFIKNIPYHSKRPFLIGLAYEFQKISPQIVPSPWDVPLDIVVTENEIYTKI